jgi:hypothetical protein
MRGDKPARVRPPPEGELGRDGNYSTLLLISTSKAPAVLLLGGSSASPQCSSLAPCLPRLCPGAPNETFSLALAVLLLCSLASLVSVCFWLIVEFLVISKNACDSHLQSSLFI